MYVEISCTHISSVIYISTNDEVLTIRCIFSSFFLYKYMTKIMCFSHKLNLMLKEKQDICAQGVSSIIFIFWCYVVDNSNSTYWTFMISTTNCHKVKSEWCCWQICTVAALVDVHFTEWPTTTERMNWNQCCDALKFTVYLDKSVQKLSSFFLFYNSWAASVRVKRKTHHPVSYFFHQ